MQPPISILFVCMGNICRSPLAQGIFQSTAAQQGVEERFHLDSAATGSWHIGDAPDSRGQSIALKHGVDISAQRCRQIQLDDFYNFHLILGMDQNNIDNLVNMAPRDGKSKIHLFMQHAGLGSIEVPDPYYGAQSGFEETYQMLKTGSQALLRKLIAN